MTFPHNRCRMFSFAPPAEPAFSPIAAQRVAFEGLRSSRQEPLTEWSAQWLLSFVGVEMAKRKKPVASTCEERVEAARKHLTCAVLTLLEAGYEPWVVQNGLYSLISDVAGAGSVSDFLARRCGAPCDRRCVRLPCQRRATRKSECGPSLHRNHGS